MGTETGTICVISEPPRRVRLSSDSVGPAAGRESWLCECCGVRSCGEVTLLQDKGVHVVELWLCDRCAAMRRVCQMAATIHYLREGHPAPFVVGWLESGKEPRTPHRSLWDFSGWLRTDADGNQTLKVPECLGARSAQGVVATGAPADDYTMCEVCGLPKSAKPRALTHGPTDTPLVSISACGRCKRMPLVHQMAGVIYFIRQGRPSPNVDRWLSLVKDPKDAPAAQRPIVVALR